MNLRQFALTLILPLGLLLLSAFAGAQQIEIKGPKNSNSQLSGSTYGPVTSSDTLWRIASRYRQNKNLTVYQVMQGIYQLNPDAFDDDNFNHLKDGSILSLPSERYIARIDSEQARLKAENDDSYWSSIEQSGNTDSSVKTRSLGAASKEDLSETKQIIEDKLTELDAEQNRQFMAIRQQFSESISSVQSLIGENRKVLDRLDGVDQDITELRGKVDVEIQSQMDQMLELQNELLSMSKEQEIKRQLESEKSSFAWLTDPITLIALTILLTLSLLAGWALWLIRRNNAADSKEMILSDDEGHAVVLEQSDEMDELAEALSNELSDELANSEEDDLFADEELLDDVLSEELKESLDESVDDEFDNFDDLGDDNLEPIVEETNDQDEGLLEQEDLDSLFDEDEELLAQIDDDADSDIELQDSVDVVDELDDVDELIESTSANEDTVADNESEVLDEQPEVTEEQQRAPEEQQQVPEEQQQVPEEQPEVVEQDVIDEIIPIVEDEQEKPEISIDELLEQPEIELPDSVIEAESDLMDDEMLQNLDKEISQQSEKLDSVADNLLNEIEQLEQMGGLLDDFDDEPALDELQDSEKQHSIQELESVTDDLEDEISDELADNEEASDQNSESEDDLLASLDYEIPSLGDTDGEFNDDELEEALNAFDEDAIESDFAVEDDTSEVSKSSVELDDLPGLGEWLTEDGQSENKDINELESSSFDEILDGIEENVESLDLDALPIDGNTIDDSGLDFDALLSDIDTTETPKSDSAASEADESNFVDVEDLISESEEADEEHVEKKLNLDSAFGSLEGLPSEANMVDVDDDQGIGAKLDLAQAYIETDEIEAAKSLLEDILQKGDEAQQLEAKELLNKLS